MKKIIMTLSIIAFSFLTAHSVLSAEIHHRSFTKQEIETMSNIKAIIKTEYGDITLQFFPDVAPNHVDNFISLAEKGYYNGTIFHRVIPGFMIQGGDPNTKSEDRSIHGTGGPGYALKAEFNKMHHKKGILSMARTPDPDSAGSQFFICVNDAPHLNGQYTVFGQVISGMDVVEKIVSEPRDRRDNPIKRIEITVAIIRPEKKE
jgi:peptidyl-prolyl cis-trans isomerase B (cyclophilin B)